MKPSRYLLLGLALALLLVACGGGQTREAGDQPAVVTSDDGQVQLEIPSGALPDGVEIDDISITHIQDPDLDFPDFPDTDGGSFLTYDLQPSGLQFLSPVNFSLVQSIDGTDQIELPMLFHSTEEGEQSLELVDNLQVSIDLESQELTAQAQIDHFSRIYYGQNDFVGNPFGPQRGPAHVEIRTPTQVMVGDAVQVSGEVVGVFPGRVVRGIQNLAAIGGAEALRNQADWEWTKAQVTGATLFERVNPGSLEPNQAFDLWSGFPFDLEHEEEESFSNRQFTCTEPGETQLVLEMDISGTVLSVVGPSGDREGVIQETSSKMRVTLRSQKIECVSGSGDAPTETETETSTVAPSPTPVPLGGKYQCSFSIGSDPAGHAAFVALATSMQLDVMVEGDQITITGTGAFVPVTGTIDENGSFEAMGNGNVAGFSGIDVTLTGSLHDGILEAEYSMGTSKGLPEEEAITYNLVCERIQEEAASEGTPTAANEPLATATIADETPEAGATSTPEITAQEAFNEGKVFYEQGLSSEALDSFNQAIALDAAFKEAYYNAGVILLEQEKYAEAQEYFLHAVQLDATYDLALFGLARTHGELQQWEDELAAWEDFLVNHPADDDLRTYATQRVNDLHAAGYGDG